MLTHNIRLFVNLLEGIVWNSKFWNYMFSLLSVLEINLPREEQIV
jgi:hypothetical protein